MEEEGNFACPLDDCGMRFDNEDNLAAHRKKHDLSLSLTPTPTFKSSLFDQTPTPTRFLKDLDSELFQELHDNPFDVTFRRANSLVGISGQIQVPEASNLLFSNVSDTEPLNTPSITLTNDHDISLGHASRHETSVILRKKSFRRAQESNTQAETNLQTVPFSENDQLDLQVENKISDNVSSDDSGIRSKQNLPNASAHSSLSSKSPSSSSPVVQDSLITSAGSDASKDTGIESVVYSTVVQTPVITSVSSIAKNTATCVPTAVVVTRCTTADTATLSSSVTQLSVAADPPKAVVTEQSLLQGLTAAAPVVQLIIRLPDGQTMPVKIPAVVTLPQATLGASTATIVSSSGNSGTATSQSLVKKRLKEVLSGSRSSPSVSNTNSSSIPKLPLPSASHIAMPQFDNSLSESPPSSPHSSQNSQTGGKRRRRELLEDPEVKRKKSLERNRAAATRCRQKRKQWIQTLEKKAEELNETNKLLQHEVTMLRNEVATLKTMLLAHKDCPVTQQQKACGIAQINVVQSVENVSVPQHHPSVNGVASASGVELIDTESSSSQSSGASIQANYAVGSGL